MTTDQRRGFPGGQPQASALVLRSGQSIRHTTPAPHPQESDCASGSVWLGGGDPGASSARQRPVLLPNARGKNMPVPSPGIVCNRTNWSPNDESYHGRSALGHPACTRLPVRRYRRDPCLGRKATDKSWLETSHPATVRLAEGSGCL